MPNLLHSTHVTANPSSAARCVTRARHCRRSASMMSSSGRSTDAYHESAQLSRATMIVTRFNVFGDMVQSSLNENSPGRADWTSDDRGSYDSQRHDPRPSDV